MLRGSPECVMREHFVFKESLVRRLEVLEMGEDEIKGILKLAKTYGSIKIPNFKASDDAWGGHWSLFLQDGGHDWVLVLEEVKYY